MNKELIKLAMIGLTAGLCISSAPAPKDENKEVAMSKCSKDTPSDAEKDSGSSCSGNQSCGSLNGCKESQSDASSVMPAKRKSAAQKAVQGP